MLVSEYQVCIGYRLVKITGFSLSVSTSEIKNILTWILIKLRYFGLVLEKQLLKEASYELRHINYIICVHCFGM